MIIAILLVVRYLILVEGVAEEKKSKIAYMMRNLWREAAPIAANHCKIAESALLDQGVSRQSTSFNIHLKCVGSYEAFKKCIGDCRCVQTWSKMLRIYLRQVV
jgi:hypothetical protein